MHFTTSSVFLFIPSYNGVIFPGFVKNLQPNLNSVFAEKVLLTKNRLVPSKKINSKKIFDS